MDKKTSLREKVETILKIAEWIDERTLWDNDAISKAALWSIDRTTNLQVDPFVGLFSEKDEEAPLADELKKEKEPRRECIFYSDGVEVYKENDNSYSVSELGRPNEGGSSVRMFNTKEFALAEARSIAERNRQPLTNRGE